MHADTQALGPPGLSSFHTDVPDVYFIIGRGSKLEAAALTGVRLLLAVVHSAVSDQLALLSETLVTIGTIERLLACNRETRRTLVIRVLHYHCQLMG